MKSNKLVRIAIVSAVAAASLSGCSTYNSAINYMTADNAAICPDAAILASTAKLPAFDPAKGPDPSNVVYTVAMTSVKTRCSYTKRSNEVDASVVISFHAVRQPGGEQVSYRVPYYVALTNNGEIKDKKLHTLEFGFTKGEPSVTAEDAVDSIEFKVERGKRSYEYHLLVGFQLTKAQLDYNNTTGHFEP